MFLIDDIIAKLISEDPGLTSSSLSDAFNTVSKDIVRSLVMSENNAQVETNQKYLVLTN